MSGEPQRAVASRPVADRDPAGAACWRALRLLAAAVAASAQPPRCCWLRIGPAPAVLLDRPRPPAGSGWSVLLLLDAAVAERLPPPGAGESRYLVEDLIALRPLGRGDLPEAAADLLETYAPYCLAAPGAPGTGGTHPPRPLTVTHFAQSLDGRIATCSGDSKWIGCPDNRVHAHRMRALCDGILIGAGTLRADRPALTVRHVEGRDPIRIVLGRVAERELASLRRAGDGPILVLGDGPPPSSPQIERLPLARRNGRLATPVILEALYQRGIRSLYIEGGATTTSAFLADRTIDVLQLHISPLILGGGIAAFSRPEIRSVAESLRFSTHLYRPIGDGILFVGRLGAGG